MLKAARLIGNFEVRDDGTDFPSVGIACRQPQLVTTRRQLDAVDEADGALRDPRPGFGTVHGRTDRSVRAIFPAWSIARYDSSILSFGISSESRPVELDAQHDPHVGRHAFERRREHAHPKPADWNRGSSAR